MVPLDYRAESKPLDASSEYLDRAACPPLSREGTVACAKRVEAGVFAAKLLDTCDPQLPLEEREAATESLRRSFSAGYDTDSAEGAAQMKTDFEAMLGRYTADRTSRRLLRRAATDGEEAKTELTQANLRLVAEIVHKDFYEKVLSEDDMIQLGTMGLVHAVKKFDHTQGNAFSTYAKWWIKRDILRGLSEENRQIYMRETTAEQERANQLAKARSRLSQKLGQSPTAAQLAAESDLKESYVADFLASDRLSVSLDMGVGSDGSALGSFVQEASDDGTEGMAVRTEAKRAMEAMLMTLSATNRQIVQGVLGFRDGEPLSYNEVGRQVGLCGTAVSAHYRSAIEQLRGSDPALLSSASQLLED
jgi:RNA polymerase sigma factor (sigma-70 family)